MANKNQEYTEQYADYAMEQKVPTDRAVWRRMRTTTSVSRPRPNGLPGVAGTACIPMTSRTRSSAVMTAWAIRMSTTHAS